MGLQTVNPLMAIGCLTVTVPPRAASSRRRVLPPDESRKTPQAVNCLWSLRISRQQAWGTLCCCVACQRGASFGIAARRLHRFTSWPALGGTPSRGFVVQG